MQSAEILYPVVQQMWRWKKISKSGYVKHVTVMEEEQNVTVKTKESQ